MITLQNVSKSFFSKKKCLKVLNDININIKQSEIFGIIGKSGAGKSTLIKCLNLLEIPDSGKIIVDGIDLVKANSNQLRLARQNIGVIFQNFNLLNSKTVYDNVALPLVLQGNHPKKLIKERVDELLELVGLTNFANKYPQSLSGGQKQRVGIARALATNPKILLSDEATSALDPQTTNNILELLLDINYKFGLTIVLITHEIDVVRKICDKIAVIDNGIIVESGDAVEIILHPKHELTRKMVIEEESTKYLEQVKNFYKFSKNINNYLILVSFLGDQTFQPLLSQVSIKSGVVFSILHG